MEFPLLPRADDKDKLFKVIQNLSRLVSYALKYSNHQMSNNFSALSTFTRDSRKMFGLFRSIDFIHQLHDLLLQKETPSKYKDIIFSLSKCLYYLFDNIQLICGFNLLPFNRGNMNNFANIALAISFICTLAKNLYQLYNLLEKKEARMNSLNNNEGLNSSGCNDKDDIELNRQIFYCFIETSGKVGDLLTVLNGSGVLKLLFTRHSDVIGCIGGLWAGFVALWLGYTKTKVKIVLPLKKDEILQEQEEHNDLNV